MSYIPFDKLSEGEEFLAEFFKEESFRFKQQHPISNLKGDSKAYRVADFYLPSYNMYVEFFGNWNKSPEHKTEYIEKMQIYRKNGIPCIYFFPENLGFIKHAFCYRMVKEMKRMNLKKELLRFRSYMFYDKYFDNISLFLFMAFILILVILGGYFKGIWYWIIGCSGIMIYSFYKLFIGYKKIFKN